MNEKLGAFIVPTGVGASIGGYAGDASLWARKFAEKNRLIVNPNVVNAGCFSGISNNMLYVEGYSLDEFFKGNINLKPTLHNKIGIIFDKAIPQDVLNIHINTINAVKTVYGIEIIGYELTESDVGVDFFVNDENISTGTVKNIETVIQAGQRLIDKGAEALAIVCRFEESISEEYNQGTGVDPIGGVEAIISHSVSKTLKIPCAHSPAFDDYSISSELVSPKAAAEYITPTFLPCVLIGLANAPRISNIYEGISINDLNYLLMPYNSLGSIPVLECIKKNIQVYAIKENVTLLNVTIENFAQKCGIHVVDTYKECLELV